MINKEPNYVQVRACDLKPGQSFWFARGLDPAFECRVTEGRAGHDNVPWVSASQWCGGEIPYAAGVRPDLKIYVKKEGNND